MSWHSYTLFALFFLSLLFMQLTHPLSAGIILLIQTTFIALASGLISSSFWFSYILFLIFLGGMLVLFIYVASLASNEAFKISLLSGLLILFSTSVSSLIITLLDLIFISNNMLFNQTVTFISEQMNSTPFFIYQIYNFPVAILTLFIILYLLSKSPHYFLVLFAFLNNDYTYLKNSPPIQNY